MKRIVLFIGLLALLTCSPSSTRAQDPSVEEIVKTANKVAFYAGDDGIADVSMTITDAQGRKRQREMRILRKDQENGGEQKFFVFFYEPADVAKTVFMVWKHIGQDDDRWLYLPALDLVRRIAATDKRSSFVGSHFVYEDVSGRSLEADTHELLPGDDARYYLVKNTPKEKKGVEFAYYHVWIDKENFMPVKAEYFNDKDELVRRITAVNIETIEGHTTVTLSRAEDLVRGGSTDLEFKNVRYDVGLDDSIFAERYLRRPPVQWTKR